MAGYDGKTRVNPLGLMAKRLGVYYQQPTNTTVDYTQGLKDTRSLMARRLGLMYNGDSVNADVVSADSVNTTSEADAAGLEGISHQDALLHYNGGHLQQERMIYDKRRTLDRVVLYSYQGADVIKADADETERPVRALINPNKLKQDYDDKVLSIGYEYGFRPGDVFKWVGTNTYWLIYLQDLTELAYFRGDIRKCSYQISWKDEDGEVQSVYAAIRGPVETKIQHAQKGGVDYNYPNYSLNLLIPKTEAALKYFRRYSKFYLGEPEPGAPTVCWRVEAANWLSMPGVIEITATEYFVNEDLDDIENGIVGGDAGKLEVGDLNDEVVEATLVGETFIKPKKTYTYTYQGASIANGYFSVDKKYPVTIVQQEGDLITIKWNTSYSGQFELNYVYKTTEIIKNEDMTTTVVEVEKVVASKIIVVESLF